MAAGSELAKIIGKALFYASIQTSIGSCAMSSIFSVLNFSKDQTILQRAADSLRHYVLLGSVWMIATVLVLYSSHGWCGAWIGLAASLVMMGWLVISYIYAFKQAAKENGLQDPTVFHKSDWILATIAVVVLAILIAYFGGYFGGNFGLDTFTNLMK